MSSAEHCRIKSLNFYCSVGTRHGRPLSKHSLGNRPDKAQHCPFILWAAPFTCVRLLEYGLQTAWDWARASQCISHRPANSCSMLSKCYDPMLDMFSLPTSEKLCAVLVSPIFPYSSADTSAMWKTDLLIISFQNLSLISHSAKLLKIGCNCL